MIDDQAHAYAYLLDQLGLNRVAVVALSHGGPSTLLFALLYPERVSSLTCISCGVAPSASEDQQEANQKGDMLTTIYKYNALYWTATKLFKKQFLGLLGATDKVVESLSAEPVRDADRLIISMPLMIRCNSIIMRSLRLLTFPM